VSDPPRVLLLDSNAYFRLARTLHPLLAPPFGTSPRYSLMILAELDREYRSSNRLRTKFEWVNGREYQADRAAHRYETAGKSTRQVDMAFSFLEAHARAEAINVSPEDLRALAVGHARNFVVVTDDAGMKRLADAFEIECWSVLKLLRLMQTEARIALDDVRQAIEYMVEANDLPMGRDRFRSEYRAYFNADCPI
jgi:hypothetical protein